MSIEEKYYCPDPSEFYLGFEFQFLTGGTEWKSFILDNNRIERVFDNLKEHPEMFRFKYLSRECIQSLGWEYVDSSVDGEEDHFTKYNEEFMEDHSLDIVYNSSYCSIYCEESPSFYGGFIKNKSELQLIMRMTEI